MAGGLLCFRTNDILITDVPANQNSEEGANPILPPASCNALTAIHPEDYEI
jgi:hypothetical protein